MRLTCHLDGFEYRAYNNTHTLTTTALCNAREAIDYKVTWQGSVHIPYL